MSRQEKAKQALQTQGRRYKQAEQIITLQSHHMGFCVVSGPHLPSRRSLRGPYLSMTMPMGSVMADSRKEPTVKARFSISSWSLQMVQPFISRYSSD